MQEAPIPIFLWFMYTLNAKNILLLLKGERGQSTVISLQAYFLYQHHLILSSSPHPPPPNSPPTHAQKAH